MPSPSPAIDPPQRGRGEIRRARPLLGTLVEIGTASELGADRVQRAIERAFQAVARIQALMSRHDPDSELSRLNRTAAQAPQRVDPHTAAVLGAALRFARLSHGAFDPTIAIGATAATAAAGPCWRDVELDADLRVRYRRPLHLDFGGIAKGYAVDQAARSLLDDGIRDFIVNAGGDLRVGGERTVWLRDPVHLGAGHCGLRLRNQALATSAAYFSPGAGGGNAAAHLVDPVSRLPYRGTTSCSVLADDCLRADALTKIVLFAPPAIAERVLGRERARAIVLDPSLAA